MEDAAAEQGRSLGAYFQRQTQQWLDFSHPKEVQSNPTGDIVKPGLYVFGTPSGGSVCVLRVGWLRPAEGGDPDEWECLHQVAPRRKGDYQTALDEVADKGPPKAWGLREPFKKPTPYHRFQIFHPWPCDEGAWAKACPKPKDWKSEP